LRESERSQIVVTSSKMKAVLAKDQKQLQRRWPFAIFMPIEMSG